jgi:predicted glycosyltransferase
MQDHRTVFICPLDWGLGHASRMIPVVTKFIRSGFHVILGGSGKSGDLLKITFPHLSFVLFPASTIRYSKGKLLWVVLMWQLPRMVISVFKEHKLIKHFVKTYSLDIVVSDNRYGLFCQEAYTIFVTHQISPMLPTIFRWLEYPLYLIIKNIIQRYNECWIPDFEDKNNNISGKLSHLHKKPRNARYIGILSRFSLNKLIPETPTVDKYNIVVILSGPEPQISKFEKIVHEQISTCPLKTIIINGLREIPLPGSNYQNNQITTVSHLDIQQFGYVLSHADAIICRSGYSGIMDLIALGRSALLIPTPGQPEQKYLAKYLGQKGWFYYSNQDEFDVDTMLEKLSFQTNIQFPVFYNGSDDLLINITLNKKHSKNGEQANQES